jgi:rod shape determining protein RodA
MYKASRKYLNTTLLFPALLLVVFGLISFYILDIYFFKQQLIALGIALVAYFVLLHIDYRAIGYLSKYIYILGIIGLIIVFFVGIEARGSARWLEIFGFRLQVSEVFKPFFLIFIAQFLANSNSKSIVTYLKAIGLFIPVFLLVLKQPDLGNALVYASAFGFMLVMYGFRPLFFVISGLLLAIPLPLFYHTLHQYQKDRITAFLDITHDPYGISYNAIQALISIGSGGFLGKGFGNSTQTLLQFLPERHTDFIFATIAENLGFVGVTILITVYMYFLYRMYNLFQASKDTFTYLVVTAFFFLFLTHVFFNIGMNIALLPIVGITLPFVSYGGSSLLTNFIILGIISQVDKDDKQSILEIR